MSIVDEIRAEEREAAANHRHMERMQLEATRARIREKNQAFKNRRRELKVKLGDAERKLKKADREYRDALRSANRSSNRPFPDDRDHACERAFATCSAAGRVITKIRAELEST